MPEPISLTVGQQFEIERMGRVVDATGDIEQLRALCKQLIRAWHSQKAAARWAIEQAMDSDAQLRKAAMGGTQ